MKKILLATLFVAGLAVSAKAQKGSVLVYGTVGYNSTDYASGAKASSLSLAPGIGYQFSNNWTAGVSGGISTQKNEGGGMTNKTNGYFAGPFIRYTKDLSSTFFFFTQLDAQYMSTTNKPAVGVETKTTGFDASITPAIGINVYKRLALNFSFGSLSYMTTKVKGATDKTSSFGLNFGSQANIGISKNF